MAHRVADEAALVTHGTSGPRRARADLLVKLFSPRDALIEFVLRFWRRQGIARTTTDAVIKAMIRLSAPAVGAGPGKRLKEARQPHGPEVAGGGAPDSFRWLIRGRLYRGLRFGSQCAYLEY